MESLQTTNHQLLPLLTQQLQRTVTTYHKDTLNSLVMLVLSQITAAVTSKPTLHQLISMEALNPPHRTMQVVMDKNIINMAVNLNPPVDMAANLTSTEANHKAAMEALHQSIMQTAHMVSTTEGTMGNITHHHHHQVDTAVQVLSLQAAMDMVVKVKARLLHTLEGRRLTLAICSSQSIIISRECITRRTQEAYMAMTILLSKGNRDGR